MNCKSETSGRSLLLKIENVSMKREDRLVLDNISLDVAKGDFIAITGPNGGGKTTLLRILLGLLRPTSGRVVFPEAVRPSFGYLPQKNAIDSHFPITVEDVIESGLLTENGIDRKQKSELVDSTLALTGLTELRRRPIGKISGGQLQRTLLGRAIIRKPEVLVLDEPLSYIDKRFESKLYDIIRQLSEHATILLVSHEMSEIASMANRHIIIDRRLTECTAHHHYIAPECCRATDPYATNDGC